MERQGLRIYGGMAYNYLIQALPEGVGVLNGGKDENRKRIAVSIIFGCGILGFINQRVH